MISVRVRLRGKFFLDTNGESPFGRSTLGAPAAYRRTSAALTLLPLQWELVQTPEQQLQQKQQYNVTTQNMQRNDTLIDVVVVATTPTATTTTTTETITAASTPFTQTGKTRRKDSKTATTKKWEASQLPTVENVDVREGIAVTGSVSRTNLET